MQQREVLQTPSQNRRGFSRFLNENASTPNMNSGPVSSLHSHMNPDDSDDGGSDEEVARFAESSEKTIRTPSYNSQKPATSFNGLRKTPGPGGGPSTNSAFSRLNKGASGVRTTKPNTLTSFGLMSPPPNNLPPRPKSSSGKHKPYFVAPTPKHMGTGFMRNSALTPTEDIMKKDLLMEKRNGNYSPNTQLVLEGLEFLNNDDTPQQKLSSTKSNDLNIQNSQSFDDSVGSGHWFDRFSQDDVKVPRKGSDVSTASSGSGFSKNDGLRNFTGERSWNENLLSPTRRKEQGNFIQGQNHAFTQNSSIQDQNNVSNPFQNGPDSMAFGNGNYFSNQRGFDHGIQIMQQQQGCHPSDMNNHVPIPFGGNQFNFGHVSPVIFAGHVSPANVPRAYSPLPTPQFFAPQMHPYPVAISPTPMDQPSNQWNQQPIPHWTGSIGGNYGIPPTQHIHNQQPYHRTPSPSFSLPSHPNPNQMQWQNPSAQHYDQGHHVSYPHEDNVQYKNSNYRQNQSQEFIPNSANISTQNNTQRLDQAATRQNINGIKSNKAQKQRGLSEANKTSTGTGPVQVTSVASPQSRKSKYKKNEVQSSVMVEDKRAELVESSAVRSLIKDFLKQFRGKEKISQSSAEEYAYSCLASSDYPESTHYKIYMELADLAKRSNRFEDARKLYRQVCDLQPYACQGWLEASKLEEEYGKLKACSKLLSEGLQYCPMNENLRTKAIKHEERMAIEYGNGDLNRARHLLAPLKHLEVEKVWRTVLEGALMELRDGNTRIARSILNWLISEISWYGPLYLEAFKLERDNDNPRQALKIVDKGLKEIPRYGPLWFGAFRICEGIDMENGNLHLPRTFSYIDRAVKSISRELIWKVYQEGAQSLERAAHSAVKLDKTLALDDLLTRTRLLFAKTILACPENLCWKVWLAAGRMELSAGRFADARKLFLKSFEVVPTKGRPSVILECVSLEEFVGNVELAKAILYKTRSESKADWKVWLRSVQMEVRSGNRRKAIHLAQEGLKEHSGTGRLWATLIQLREEDGDVQQMKVLRKALQAVPKSGEVWCEAARIHLNPLSTSFDIKKSSTYLEFATKFTPQYGDSFLEALRQQMIETIIYDSDHYQDLDKVYQSQEDLRMKIVETFSKSSLSKIVADYSSQRVNQVVGGLDITRLELRCSNADPNYGKLWFRSRSKPSDTARIVLNQAKNVIKSDLEEYSSLYVLAGIRHKALQLCLINGFDINIPTVMEMYERIESNGNDLLKSISKASFVTGFIDANREVDLQKLDLFDRRKFLFGSDLLLTWKPLN